MPRRLSTAARIVLILGLVRLSELESFVGTPQVKVHQLALKSLNQVEASKLDPMPDELFYLVPRLGIYHVDDGFRAQLSELYRQLLPAGGDVFDLCSQHDSHLPQEVKYSSLTVHGMNYLELLANTRASSRIVRNLNNEPAFPELEDESMDAALMAVSIQYMQRPVELLRDVRRLLKPGGVMVISFSNRMFFQKAVAVWRDAKSLTDLSRLVTGYMKEAGFQEVRTANGVQVEGAVRGDPFLAVVAFKDATQWEGEGISWLPEAGRASIF